MLSEFWYDSQAAKEAMSSTTDLSAPSSGSPDPFQGEDSAVEPARSPSTESPASHQSTPTRIISTNRTMTKQYREGKWKGPNYYFPIPGQLQALGLGEFEGRQHSGLDVSCHWVRLLMSSTVIKRVRKLTPGRHKHLEDTYRDISEAANHHRAECANSE